MKLAGFTHKIIAIHLTFTIISLTLHNANG